MNKIKIFLYSLCIIIILTIILLYLIIFTSIIEEHPSGNSTRDLFNYRLGDIIQFKVFNKKILTKLVYKYYFSNTIASEYIKRTKNSQELPDYDILFNIMKEKTKEYNIPNNNELIVHLRIGDVIDWEYKDDIDELLEGKKHYYYLKNYGNFDKLFKKISNMNIEKIILVGGYHTQEDHSRSIEYVDKIKKYIEKNNYLVETRIDKASADEDFIYMSNSKYFLKSGGRYSDIINKMVKMNDGIIFED